MGLSSYSLDVMGEKEKNLSACLDPWDIQLCFLALRMVAESDRPHRRRRISESPTCVVLAAACEQEEAYRRTRSGKEDSGAAILVEQRRQRGAVLM